MNMSLERLVVATLPALLLPVGLLAQNIAVTAWHSDSGLGEINFQPGVNDQQFMVFGQSSPYADYGTSISPIITGDGQFVSGAGTYVTTYFTWSGGNSGTTGGSSGSTYNVDPGVDEALSSVGYGTTPWTTATLTVTAPATSFTMDFFVHDYYAGANLNVALNGVTLDNYNNIMSSAGSRNTDFVYDEAISGVNVGDTLTFRFDGLQNLGSDFANIDIMAASVNYTLPTSITDLTPTTLTPTPEPTTLTLAGLGGAVLLLFRRRKQAKI